MDIHTLTVTVNGKEFQREVEARLLLSDFLRHDLGFTGTHVGCEHGVCGACTILLDGVPSRSCLMLAIQANGHEITTVEGMGNEIDGLHPLQKAFWEKHALQCGFCTPGILLTLLPFLEQNPTPSEAEVRDPPWPKFRSNARLGRFESTISGSRLTRASQCNRTM